MRLILTTIAMMMTLSSPVVAQDFDKGLPVYNSGDYEIAFLEGCAG